MNAQKRFTATLHAAQGLSSNPDKMPCLCIIGTHDFDELTEELRRAAEVFSHQQRVSARIADEWDPFNAADKHFGAFRERIEQEEFCKEQASLLDSPPTSPLTAELEAALDPRQRVSVTETLEFCGCHCFRSLSEARGFWFA